MARLCIQQLSKLEKFMKNASFRKYFLTFKREII